MKTLSFKVTQQDGTILIYKPRKDIESYSVTHFDPKTDSARLVQNVTTEEAQRLLAEYKASSGCRVSIL